MERDLYTQLQTALYHFTLSELYQHAINQIQDLNWDDVLKYNNKIKMSQLSRNDTVKIIIDEIKKLELDTDVIIEYINNLNLLAIGISKTKSWQVYKLIDLRKKVPKTVTELKLFLESKFRINNIQTEIHAIDHDGKIIVSIRKFVSPRKKTTVIKQHPIYIIFPPTTNYILTSKQLIIESFSSALAKGLGYRDLKIIQLNGRNPNELLKLLLYKDTNRTRIDYVEPVYTPKVKTTQSVIDFTRSDEKREFVNKIYDENAQLQLIEFQTNHTCVSKGIENKKVPSRLKLISPNVKNMIIECAATGIIDMPIPDYLKNALKKGRNILQLNRVED